jgi:hypothetical protein
MFIELISKAIDKHSSNSNCFEGELLVGLCMIEGQSEVKGKRRIRLEL